MKVEMYDNTTLGPAALMAVYQSGHALLSLHEEAGHKPQSHFYEAVRAESHKLNAVHESLLGRVATMMSASKDASLPSFSLQASLDALREYEARIKGATVFTDEEPEENFWPDLHQLGSEMATHDHAKYLANFIEKCGL